MRIHSLVIFVLGSVAACTSPRETAPSAPNAAMKTATNDGDPYSPIERYYQARAAAEGWASYTLERSDLDYVRRFRRQSAGSAELREYVLHVQFRSDDPKAKGAKSLDERLIARAFEATPFPEWDVDKMVELARAQRLKLRGIDDVRWFLHVDAQLGGSEVAATDSSHRFRFRRHPSGEAAATEWRTLVLDDEGVPQRIE